MRNNGKERKHARRSSACERIENDIAIGRRLIESAKKRKDPDTVSRIQSTMNKSMVTLENTRAKM